MVPVQRQKNSAVIGDQITSRSTRPLGLASRRLTPVVRRQSEDSVTFITKSVLLPLGGRLRLVTVVVVVAMLATASIGIQAEPESDDLTTNVLTRHTDSFGNPGPFNLLESHSELRNNPLRGDAQQILDALQDGHDLQHLLASYHIQEGLKEPLDHLDTALDLAATLKDADVENPEWIDYVLPPLPSSDSSSIPQLPSFGSLPEAVTALHDFYSKPVDDDELMRLKSLPDALDNALTRIVEAYLMKAEATRLAFEDRQLERLHNLVPAADDGRSDETIKLNLESLIHTRNKVAQIVLEASKELDGHCMNDPLLTNNESATFQYDFTCSDSDYDRDALLLIDLGGDDVSQNNAGGCTSCAAMLLDVSGDDRYISEIKSSNSLSAGLMGGGHTGSGMLFDLGGRDMFNVSIDAAGISTAINGGGFLGSGFLLNTGETATYTISLDSIPRISTAINGGAYFGKSGIMISAVDASTYETRISTSSEVSAGINGGSAAVLLGVHASGTLIDFGDNTQYITIIDSIGIRGGINGGTSTGSARLVDTGNNNTYRTVIINPSEQGVFDSINLAVNGASRVRGVGIMVSTGDGNIYETQIDGAEASVHTAINGATVSGVPLDRDRPTGVLIDLGKGSLFRTNITTSTALVRAAVNGSGTSTGTGILLSYGADRYETKISNNRTSGGSVHVGVNGGAYFASGFKVNLNGPTESITTIEAMSASITAGINGGGYGGTGHLFSGEGKHHAHISSDSGSVTVGMNGGAVLGEGLLVGLAGNNSYLLKMVTGGDAVIGANGGGNLGDGALVDMGGDDSYVVRVAASASLNLAANGGGSLGQGLLFDAGGNDYYEDPTIPDGSCSDCTIAPKGLIGAQIDSNDIIP